MSSIRAACPDCGDIQLTGEDLTVRMCADADWCSYTFRCPACRARVAKDCSRRIVDLLLCCGVRLRVWKLPLELSEPRPGGLPFVSDDLLDFHQLLDRTSTIGEWVVDIKGRR